MIRTYDIVWLPYAVAAILLLGLGVVIALRRRRGSPPLAEMLLLRGGVLAVLAVTILMLADAAAEGDGVTSFDQPIWQWFVDHRTPVATAFSKTVTTLGSTVGMGVLAIAGIAFLLWRRQVAEAVLVAVVAVGASVLVLVGKHVVGRIRPPVEYRLVVETNQSFPSGHALASTAILGVLVVILRRALPKGPWRIVLVVVATLFWLSIGMSRIYLGVHWATDVLGGWLTGAAWLLFCLTVFRLTRPDLKPAIQAQAESRPPNPGGSGSRSASR